MLYSFQDKFIQEFFIENSYPSKDTIREVYEYLRGIPSDPIEMTLQEIKDDLGLSLGTSGIGTCEALLEKAGAIERLDSRQNSAGIRIDSDMHTLIDLLPRDARTRRNVMRGLEQLVGSFRGERVLVQPQKFADDLGMKWDSVKRAIRELTKLPAVNYIPPFRGRAVHVVDRKKPFHQLNIDFDELERRQKSEYEKLQRVISLATTKRCRQLEILEYFGDPDRKRCQNCDNCGSRPKTKLIEAGKTTPASNACLYAAQVALSGTARTHGRLGKTLIAQMLTGSANKKVKQLGLDRLSTFGLLKQLRQSDVTQLMEFLISQGFIDQVETTKFRPTVQISESGTELMAGKLPADMPSMMPDLLVRTLTSRLRGKAPHVSKVHADAARSSDQASSKSDSAASEDDDPPNENGVHESETHFDSGAVESHQAESTPFIESNSQIDLNQTAAAPVEPLRSMDELSAKADSSPGIDEHATALASTNAIERLDSAASSTAKPSFYWTWKLLSEGYSVDQIQQVRNLDADTVLEHAVRAAEDQLQVEPGWVLSNTKQTFLNQFVDQHSDQRPAGLLSKLPAGVTAHELLLFLACRQK
jgi:ATP-dependent DNA helicase RecQ